MLPELLEAIVGDRHDRVNRLLAEQPGLACRSVQAPKLYESGIFHWLYEGDTPLHLAAAGYRLEISRLLMAAGADPNAILNGRQSAPLHYAADGYIISPAWDAARQVKTIQYLLQAGAHIHGQDKNGATPLHRAVRTRCAGAVSCLLDAGSDPERRNKSGSTPFHLAVQNTGRGGSGAVVAKEAQREIIAAFVARGVSTQSKDGKGKSVLECASSDWIRELLG